MLSQAPGADAKHRLSNETDTYGEMIFVNNWINPNRESGKAWMKTEELVQANTTQSSNIPDLCQLVRRIDGVRRGSCVLEQDLRLELRRAGRDVVVRRRSFSRFPRCTRL